MCIYIYIERETYVYIYIYISSFEACEAYRDFTRANLKFVMPNLPTNIIPTNIA